MVATRPNIAIAVGVVSRYMSNPSKKHWEAIKKILRYIKGIATSCLRFKNNDACIVGYTNAEYAGCVDSRKSTSSYVFMFVGAAISWRSCLQDCTSLSTTEAEYVAAFDASKD
ncbi:hypothetical protein L7F22_048411 [Adiantum nelumboides]|nr:hypothetical protein [Adiantum nelumboides]